MVEQLCNRLAVAMRLQAKVTTTCRTGLGICEGVEDSAGQIVSLPFMRLVPKDVFSV
jgi:hypothetical protein